MRNCLMKRFKRLFRECKVIGRSDEKFHKNVGRMMGPFRSGSGGGGDFLERFSEIVDEHPGHFIWESPRGGAA